MPSQKKKQMMPKASKVSRLILNPIFVFVFKKLISNKPTCFCQERTFSLSAELSWATQHPISQTFLKHNLKHNTDIWHRVVFVSSEFQTFPLFISILIQQVPCIAFCLSRPFRQLLAGSLLCPCY